MSIETPTRRTVAPITCVPWCERGDGHPDEMFFEDQTCFAPENHTPLSLHKPIRFVDGSSAEDYMNVYAEKQNRQVAHIYLDHGETSQGVSLIPSEARALAAALLDAAEKVEAVS